MLRAASRSGVGRQSITTGAFGNKSFSSAGGSSSSSCRTHHTKTSITSNGRNGIFAPTVELASRASSRCSGVQLASIHNSGRQQRAHLSVTSAVAEDQQNGKQPKQADDSGKGNNNSHGSGSPAPPKDTAQSKQEAAASSRFAETPRFPPPSFPKYFGANQVVPLDDEMQSRFKAILAVFPPPIRFAFAYGSGVFKQSEAGPEHSKRPATRDGKKMVDVVMAVAHTEHWHAINMEKNKKHYSFLARLLGGIGLGAVQRMGAGLWYHPYIQIGDELVKYGIIDINTLCQDLLDWDTLYVSGRMHKPVALGITDARVRLAQQVNLASALRTSLLLLPESFTEVELYTRIASLSYTGDFRMSVPGGENANKVRNIVLAQRDIFRRLYGGLVRSLETVTVEETRANRFHMTQDRSDRVRAEYASKLPLRLREKLQQHYTSSPDRDPAFLKLSMSSKSENITRKPGARASSLDPDVMHDFWKAVVRQPDFETVLLAKISEIVRGPARIQSAKGIYTAGFSRTFRYVLAKVGKYFEGR